MSKISVFSFNTTSGLNFLLKDVTVEEIKSALHAKFPKWSDEVVEKFATNEKYYVEVLPVAKEEKKKTKRVYTFFKDPIVVEGFALNDILRLGKSLHSYHKNGYRQWGTCINEVFDDWKITPSYNEFERRFERIVKEIPKGNKQAILQLTLDMCDAMEKLKTAIINSGILKEKGEFIEGVGRRLGLKELTKRIAEYVGETKGAFA